MRGFLGSLALRACAAGSVIGAAGCGGGGGGEGPLLRALGDELDLVVLATPAQVGDRWAARAATQLVPELPACVRERALAAEAVAAVWAQRDGADGAWSVVLTGGGAAAAGCDALERAGALAWYGPDPRRGGGRFFAGGERKRRWRRLGRAPVRALGDVEVQAGIVVRADGTLDPRDGVDARATLRFDERDAADGFEDLRQRFVRRLDRKRLGGAWPVFAAEVERDPRDASGRTLVATLRLPGRSGEEAAVFALNAWRAGDLGAPPAPCPWIADAWKAEIECTERRILIARALRDRVLDDPALLATEARVVPSMHHGTPNGFKLYAIRSTSLAAALGLQNGDRILRVGGAPAATAGEAAAALEGLRRVTEFEVEVERRGDHVTLSYEIR